MNTNRIIRSLALVIPVFAFLVSAASINLFPSASLLKALSWGGLILQAAYGYSLLVERFGAVQLPLGSHFGIGFSVLIAAGSFLNLFGFGSNAAIYCLIGIGVLFFTYTLLFRYRYSALQFRKFKAISILLVLICSLVYLYSFRIIPFNDHDDFHAYLVFPYKFLELGELGMDPYNERRLSSAFGGNAFIFAVMLSGAKLQFLHAMDFGVAKLAIIFSVLMIPLESSRLAFILKTALIGAILFLVAPAVNITPIFLPILLMLTLWLLMPWRINSGIEGGNNWPNAILFGLVLSALCSLKNSFIPYSAILGVFFIYAIASNRRNYLPYILSMAIAFLLFLTPWMIDLFKSSGTPLYPLLGNGFHASQYGDFSSPRDGLFTSGQIFYDVIKLISSINRTLLLLSCLYLAITIWIFLRFTGLSRSVRIRLLAPASASLIYAGSTLYLLGGYGTYRFIFSGIVCGLLIAPILFVQLKLSKKFIVFAVSISLILFGHSLRGFWMDFIGSPPTHFFYTSSEDEANKMRLKKYAQISASIPKDGDVLVRVAEPYLLQPRSNLYVTDFPGASSPKPGMPFDKGPEALLEYLRAQGIRYVVWDYGTSAGFSEERYGDRLRPTENPWARSQAQRTFDFQKNLEMLRRILPNQYDFDGVVVLDLGVQPI